MTKLTAVMVECALKLSPTALRHRLIYIVLGAAFMASASAQVRIGSDRDNTAQQQKKPYVVLVGLDGFRSDYADRYHATHLQAIGDQGVHTALTPVFPSLTFPNFYSMATGLYPEHHGIVEMKFYDPQKKRAFRYTDRNDASDGSWFGGVPIWVLAQRQGMRTASFFWVGSEAEIAGARPSYYIPYDGKIPNEARVAQVIDWLKLPPSKRPHLITVYFSDADDAGHHFGPDSAELRDAVERLDRLAGTLTARLKELNLPVNVVIVSDHGMIQLKRTPIALDAYLAPHDMPDPAKNVSPIDLYANSPEQADRWYNALHNKDSRFEAYRRADVPAHLHYSTGSRIGDIVLIRRDPVHLFDRLPSPLELARYFETHVGDHGFDPALIPEMKGIFYAQGPNIRAETRIAPPESIEIYPLVARILGLKIEGHVDASGKIAKTIYRQ